MGKQNFMRNEVISKDTKKIKKPTQRSENSKRTLKRKQRVKTIKE